MNLKSVIEDARTSGIAVGHFNISDSVGLRAVFAVAQNLSAEAGQKIPLIIGTSEGEREFIGPAQAVALVRSLREEHNYPIFLNADHTHSREAAIAAARAGYDAVLFDGSKLPFEENVRQTREVVEEVKAVDQNIIVEGEVGYIGSSSKILKEIPADAAISENMLTTPDEARKFVEETAVDLFAPAVGNLHGMLAGAPNPSLNIERISAILKSISVPLVLHGGSGLRDEEFTQAIAAGVSVVHISTEIRAAWRKALDESLRNSADEISPYRVFAPVTAAMMRVVERRLRLFQKL